MDSTEERVTRLEENVQDLSRGLTEVRDSVRHLEHRLDGRFATLEERFTNMEQRFDTRFANLEERFEVRSVSMENHVDKGFDVLENRFNGLFNAQMVIAAAVIGGFIAVVAALVAR